MDHSRPLQKAGDKLGTRKMTERLSRLAVVCYQQTYTRGYLEYMLGIEENHRSRDD